MTITEPLPYEGRHLIADLHGCAGLDDLERVRAALLGGAEAAGAHVIDTRFHAFGPGQGITGIALLAESHISIHSWPEHGYAAVDIFMCGRRHDLDRALAAVSTALSAAAMVTHDISRGYCAERPATTALAAEPPLIAG